MEGRRKKGRKKGRKEKKEKKERKKEENGGKTKLLEIKYYN